MSDERDHTIDDDFVPWGDPEIRENYEAALGRFILAFNEVDYRIANVVSCEFASRNVPELIKFATGGNFAKRLALLESLQGKSTNVNLRAICFKKVKDLSQHRNKLAHGHFDENPYDGTYELLEKAKSHDYPIEKIELLTSELTCVLQKLRLAETWFNFEDVMDAPRPQ